MSPNAVCPHFLCERERRRLRRRKPAFSRRYAAASVQRGRADARRRFKEGPAAHKGAARREPAGGALVGGLCSPAPVDGIRPRARGSIRPSAQYDLNAQFERPCPLYGGNRPQRYKTTIPFAGTNPCFHRNASLDKRLRNHPQAGPAPVKRRTPQRTAPRSTPRSRHPTAGSLQGPPASPRGGAERPAGTSLRAS